MQKLRVLDVSRNQLSGTLPQTYANLWQLSIAMFHDNRLMRVSSSMPEFFHVHSSTWLVTVSSCSVCV
jgi:hypothetical protein